MAVVALRQDLLQEIKKLSSNLLNECIDVKIGIENHFRLLAIRLENVRQVHDSAFVERDCNSNIEEQ
jgi:hypothetical protein